MEIDLEEIYDEYFKLDPILLNLDRGIFNKKDLKYFIDFHVFVNYENYQKDGICYVNDSRCNYSFFKLIMFCYKKDILVEMCFKDTKKNIDEYFKYFHNIKTIDILEKVNYLNSNILNSNCLIL